MKWDELEERNGTVGHYGTSFEVTVPMKGRPLAWFTRNWRMGFLTGLVFEGVVAMGFVYVFGLSNAWALAVGALITAAVLRAVDRTFG